MSFREGSSVSIVLKTGPPVEHLAQRLRHQSFTNFAEKLWDTLRHGRSLNRRREARYPTHDSVQYQILPGQVPWLPATVLDVSRSGLRLELPLLTHKDCSIESLWPGKMSIFGEIRYCCKVGRAYEAGVLIQGIVNAEPNHVGHFHDDQLSLYLAGKGLTAAEVIGVREHLVSCELCRNRLEETQALLNQMRTAKLLSGAER